ncbi:MAG: HD domain-containing protein [Syntrophaceae bacterium]|nr:HD domain-containing protein [Syntrophaceae bacterium]
MQDFNLSDFLKISAVLNYQLSARQRNWHSVASIVLDGKPFSNHDCEALLHTFDYLEYLYGNSTRNLGPFSVLHPLRATALLSHASKKADLLDLMTCLLHDSFEDFQPVIFKNSKSLKPNESFQSFLSRIPRDHQPPLIEHVRWLTKEPEEPYYHYIGRFLDQAGKSPEVISVKLADRLDNTFDMRIDLQDPLQGIDFFKVVYQVLFTDDYKGYKPEKSHQPTVILNGAERLYQLFKNIVLLSLIRQKKTALGDSVSRKLFQALAEASMQEAQRIALHIFGYHAKSVAKFKKCLLELMNYAREGGFHCVRHPNSGYRLDGILISIFDQTDRNARKKQLSLLYEDKSLMIEVAIAFVSVFLNFLNDSGYYLHGIGTKGIHPEAP